MVDNSDISRMLHVLSSSLTAEVEVHNKMKWKNEDVLRLYECLKAAISETQHQFCCQDDSDYLPRPCVDPSDLLEQ